MLPASLGWTLKWCCYAHFVDDKAEVHLRVHLRDTGYDTSLPRQQVPLQSFEHGSSESKSRPLTVRPWSPALRLTNAPGTLSSWILALSQIQCKEPGRANSVVTVWSLPGSWPRKSQYFSSSPKTEKTSVPVWRPSLIWVRVRLFVQPVG